MKVLFLLQFIEICFAVASYVPTRPVFKDAYVVKGTLHIPYSEIKEPFYAWYDAAAGSSRIDYYGGMVKTFQLSNAGEYGSSMKIVPLTMDKVMNKKTCLKIDGGSDMPIKPQTILPDTTGMEFITEEEANGEQCEKWRLQTTVGDKTNKYILWIKSRKAVSNPHPIPVKYAMYGFNTLLGSHYDHYHLNYESYLDETPSADVFQLDDNMNCTGFPGPGDHHLVTFNPMMEFIHRYDDHIDAHFEDFKNSHGKKYSTHKEHHTRKNIFRHNWRFIESTNRANRGFNVSINHLADRTDVELKALRGKMYSGIKNNGGLPFPYSSESLKVPEMVNWRLAGAVTPVKDQSVCGSCWSFGSTGVVESAYFLKHGKLVRLSQQALIDCSWGEGNNGCDGGEDFRSYQWIMKNGGLPGEEEYGGYLSQDGYCHADTVEPIAKLHGFVNVTTNDVNALKIALAEVGPVSIAIDASRKTFSFYSNGVYYDSKCGNTEDRLDHAVLAVGYGTLNGKDYWLVKNSWSTYWGNDGYILMAQKDNNCGVLTAPTYPLVA